jgi:hypothetical protein
MKVAYTFVAVLAIFVAVPRCEGPPIDDSREGLYGAPRSL